MVLRLGFLASHGGSGMRAILQAVRDGRLDAQGCVMISNNEGAGAHEVAKSFGVPSLVISARSPSNEGIADQVITETLTDHGVELVILSGYMRMLGPKVLARYRNRILNVHPALLPSFGGKGMYGDRVHAAVLAAEAAVSGATVHVVDEVYDHGAVVARQEVAVMSGDTVDTLRARVQAAEQDLFVRVLCDVAAGRVDLDGVAGN